MLCPQNDAVTQQLAAIFTHCYGSSPVPGIPEIRRTLPARLGARPPPPRPQCLRSSPWCPPSLSECFPGTGGPWVTSLLFPRAQILTF